MTKNFGPMKWTREKKLNPQNSHEKKFWTIEIPTKKKFGSTKNPREKILDQLNTHEKISRTNDKPTRRSFSTTKHPNFKNTIVRWQETQKAHDGSRPTEFSTLFQENDKYFY